MNDADSVEVGWAGVTQARLSSTGRVWQVNTRGRKVAQMSLSELAVSLKAGKLSGKTLVWCDGMAAWTPLGEVPELARIAQDSEPPTSGARLIGNELQSLAGTKSYVSTGSEPPTDPGTLAIYERPLATIEFAEGIDAAPESVDEPTPAFGVSARADARTTLPGLAPEDLVPLPSSTRAVGSEPPLPPRGHAGFPSPVTSSPLGAALSSMARSNPTATPLPPGRSKPQHDVTSYAVAKATPIPSTEALQQALSAADEAASTPRPLAPSASNGVAKPLAPSASSSAARPAPPPAPSGAALKPFASTVISAEPPKPVVSSTSSAASALKSNPLATAKPSAVPASNVTISASKPLTASGAATATPNPPAAPKLPSSVARPAIEFLPPIIVQEKEDDGASIITLPLDANFHESTLVLAGRRRQRRWVPLGAAIAAAVGSACLASALTALVVRSRTPETRIVEKRVLVPIAAPPTAAPEAPPPRAASTVANAPAERTTPSNSESPKPAVTERVSSRTESSSTSPKAWRKDDPGALAGPSSSARREHAGFPTNPGF